MGFFHNKSLHVKKVEDQDRISYYMNYGKLLKQGDFISEIVREFNSIYPMFLVINTDMFYQDARINIEDKIKQTKNELDRQGVRYQEVITKKDNNLVMFGFAVKKLDKVNSYQIGIMVSPGEFHKLKDIVENNNHFCYVMKDQIEAEELLQKFIEVRGDYEELNQFFELYFYIDYNMQSIRITSSKAQAIYVDEKLNHITNKYNK